MADAQSSLTAAQQQLAAVEKDPVVAVAPTGTELSGGQGARAEPADAAGAGSDGAAVTLVSGTPTVTTRVGVSRAPLFVQDAAVTATAVSDVAITASGMVTAVSEFRTSPSNDGGPPGYDVTIALAASGETNGFSDGSRVRLEPAGAVPTVEGPAFRASLDILPRTHVTW